MGDFTDFLAWCVAPANFGYSLLLGVMALYWASVIAGALDFSFGTPEVEAPDVDADLDVDADADAHAGPAGVDFDATLDAEVDLHGGHEKTFEKGVEKASAPKWLAVLKFLNIGEVPLMLYLSFFVPIAWGLSMMATHGLGLAGWLDGLALLAPVVIVAALAAKALTTPLKALFRALNRPARLANPLDLIGRECTVASLTADAVHGQAEIPTGGVPLTLNVVTRAGVEIAKGGRAVVVEQRDAERGIYLIEAVEGGGR